MRRPLRELLDECLARTLSGEATAEECLQLYPEQADELRPLLEAATDVRQAQVPACDPAAYAAGKRRMLEALASRPLPARTSVPRALVLRRALVLAAAIFVIAAAGLLLPGWPTAEIDRQATLANAGGLVQVLPVGDDAWRAALVGERFESGDRIRTAASATAVLAFFDGSTTWLEPETEVTLAAMSSRRDGGERTTSLFQWSGATFSRVRPLPDQDSRFEIETATALAAVRGTEFALRIQEDGATLVTVNEGAVRVTGGRATVEVGELEETAVEPGGDPEPPRPAALPAPTPELPVPERLPDPPTPTRTTAPPAPTATALQPEETKDPGLVEYERTPAPVDSEITLQPFERTVLPHPIERTVTPVAVDIGKTPEPTAVIKTPAPAGTLVPVDKTETAQPALSPEPTRTPEAKPTEALALSPEPSSSPEVKPKKTNVPPGQRKTPPGQATKTPAAAANP
jgi:ferric-dicitrate binding protein FerR (iron transport regulator)